MNKVTAKKIAKSGKVTYGQIRKMLKRAYDAGAANDRRSCVNGGCSKATAYNIFWKGNANTEKYPDDRVISGLEYLGAYNALREFGDFWDGWIPETPKKKKMPDYIHQEPLDPRMPF